MSEYLQKLYSLFTYQDLVLIFLSIVVGLIVGAEREYKNKTAGLRTLMLVSVGSCTFTILSVKIGVENPDRLAANIVTGIGFLGAGAIFRDENKVSGLTTACTIWVTSALGMCIGSGHIYLGLLSTLVVMLVLLSLVGLERWIDTVNKVSVYKITTVYSPDTLKNFEKMFSSLHLKSYVVFQVKSDDKITVSWRINGKRGQHEKLSAALFAEPSILRVEI